MRLLLTCCLILAGVALHAHHDFHDIQVRSLQCGWLEGDSVRDIRNLSDFCGRSVPGQFKIARATAEHELLWIEAPTEFVSALRVDGRAATRTLLSEWLHEWKRISGYPAASVVLMFRHVEVGRAQTTLRGDAITIR